MDRSRYGLAMVNEREIPIATGNDCVEAKEQHTSKEKFDNNDNKSIFRFAIGANDIFDCFEKSVCFMFVVFGYVEK